MRDRAGCRAACRRRWSPAGRRGRRGPGPRGSRPSWAWPVTNCTRRATLRWVSDTLRLAAAPWAALMPGTTSKGMPALSSAAISSPARPKIMGSPDLRRTTRLPALARLDHQGVDVVLPAGGAMAGLADQQAPGLAPGEVEDLGRHEVVEQDHVGRAQRPHRLEGEQLRVAGAGADQASRGPCDGAASEPMQGGAQQRAPVLALGRAVRHPQRQGGEGLPEAPADGGCRASGRQARRATSWRPRPSARIPPAAAPRCASGWPGRTPAPRRRWRCRPPAASG